jgi:hypothetical protein
MSTAVQLLSEVLMSTAVQLLTEVLMSSIVQLLTEVLMLHVVHAPDDLGTGVQLTKALMLTFARSAPLDSTAVAD